MWTRRARKTPDRFFFRWRLLAKIVAGTSLIMLVVMVSLLATAVHTRRLELESYTLSTFHLVAELIDRLSLRRPQEESPSEGFREAVARIIRSTREQNPFGASRFALDRMQVDVYDEVELRHSTDPSLQPNAPPPPWLGVAIDRWLRDESETYKPVSLPESSGWFGRAFYGGGSDRQPVAIVLRLPMSAVDDAVRAYERRMLVVSLGIVSCMALAIVVYLYVTVMVPLRRINEANQALFRGRLSLSRIPSFEMPADELGNIMATHNLMLARLEEMLSHLRTAKEDAESSRGKLHENYLVLEAIKEDLEDKNRRLRELDRVKSEFLANMSHELRTPLTSIIGFTDLTLRSAGSSLPPAARSNLELVKENAAILLGMINDLLDLSKIESGKLTVFVERFDLVALAREAVASVEPLARQKGLALSTRVEGNGHPLQIETDRLKVRQILLNLLGNALKFTDRGRVEVVVRAAAPAEFDGVEVLVRDTGVGIAPADIPRIFEQFRQLDGSPTRRHGGTGLGLSIVKKLADLLGGNTLVASEPGKGSTFTVRLPWVHRTAAASPGPPSR